MSCCVETQTCVTIHSDAMTGFTSQKPSRTKAPASGFSPSTGSSYLLATPGFPLNQTEPTQGHHSGSPWTGTSEGQQYLHSESSKESSRNSQAQRRVSQAYSKALRSQWNTELAANALAAEEMARFPSQESTGAHSCASLTFDQTRSRKSAGALQVPFKVSSASSDITGRSTSPDSCALYTPTQPLDLHAFDLFYTDAEDMSVAHPNFHRDSIVMQSQPDFSLSTDLTFSMFGHDDETAIMSSLIGGVSAPPDSAIYHADLVSSPTMWDTAAFLESQRSSPTLLEDPWTLPEAMLTPPTNSPVEPEHSPSLASLSPRQVVTDVPEPQLSTYMAPTARKASGSRQSKAANDMTASRPQRSDGETIKLIGRASLEIDNVARDHPLYQNAKPEADGLYHCPWEGQAACQHKPEKLKCNYDKFVDSHLKPYRCKITSCEALHFSSTACLLRHEREAHAMHGHGDKPYLCKYENCERGVAGNGFPRHWNLRDHMRRVHNDPGTGSGTAKSVASASSPPLTARSDVAVNAVSAGTARVSKKRKAEVAESQSQAPFKAAKRGAPPSILPTSAVQQFATVEKDQLLARYTAEHQKLLDLVQQLSDPSNKNNMAFLRNASEHIKVMARITQSSQSTDAPVDVKEERG